MKKGLLLTNSINFLTIFDKSMKRTEEDRTLDYLDIFKAFNNTMNGKSENSRYHVKKLRINSLTCSGFSVNGACPAS